MNKKAIELSVNFIVILILTIIVFSLGIVFVTRIFQKADELVYQLTPQTEDEIRNALHRGQIVAIPTNYKEMRINEIETFGLGILNQLGTEKDFNIRIVFSAGTNKHGERFEAGYENSIDVSDWVVSSRHYSIENNQIQIIPLSFRVPRGVYEGTYVFNVNVCYDGSGNTDNKCPGSNPNLYDTTKQIRIRVIR